MLPPIIWRLTLAALVLTAMAVGAERPVPVWPPKGTPRIIVDADAANEVDDQYALALLLGFREKFRIEGFVAAHFGDSGGAAGIDKSFAEFERVLEKAGVSGKYPLKRGMDPLQYRDRLPDNEGVNLIIERARAATPDDPLWLVLLGPATDAAAALLKDPSIANRMIVFWHGRTQWPLRAWNFNAYNDTRATRLLFELPCRFVLFDTGTHLVMPMEEAKRRIATVGAMGQYLYEIRTRKAWLMASNKGLFDLGDIAALVDPSIARWEKVEAPGVDHDLRYDFTKKNGQIVRIYHVETDLTFGLLDQALQRLSKHE